MDDQVIKVGHWRFEVTFEDCGYCVMDAETGEYVVDQRPGSAEAAIAEARRIMDEREASDAAEARWAAELNAREEEDRRAREKPESYAIRSYTGDTRHTDAMLVECGREWREAQAIDKAHADTEPEEE